MGSTTSICQNQDATSQVAPSRSSPRKDVDSLETTLGAIFTVATSSTEDTTTREEDTIGSPNDIMRGLRAGLDLMDFRYMIPENRNMIILITHQRCGHVNYILTAENESERVAIILAMAPTAIPENRRTPAAIFLTYANFGMKVGNFEMDMNDGEVRFKTSCHLGDRQLSPEMVIFMMRTTVAMLDQFIPALTEVVYAGKDPKQAYNDAMDLSTQETLMETAVEQ